MDEQKSPAAATEKPQTSTTQKASGQSKSGRTQECIVCKKVIKYEPLHCKFSQKFADAVLSGIL